MSLEAWVSGCMTYLKSLSEPYRVEMALKKLEAENPVYGAKLRAAWEKQGK
jgi:hypothetical protein